MSEAMGMIYKALETMSGKKPEAEHKARENKEIILCKRELCTNCGNCTEKESAL